MTHNEAVLKLLSDGKTHNALELYRLGCIAHSRVADLRKRGHRIKCWTEKQHGRRVYLYRLESSLPTTAEANAAVAAVAGSEGAFLGWGSEPQFDPSSSSLRSLTGGGVVSGEILAISSHEQRPPPVSESLF